MHSFRRYRLVSLLSAAYLQRDPDLSLILWVVGASLQLILTLYVLSSWMHHDRYEITYLNPAWSFRL